MGTLNRVLGFFALDEITLKASVVFVPAELWAQYV
jgi:hypothetical protein